MDIRKYILDNFDISLDNECDHLSAKISELFIDNIIDDECHDGMYLNIVGMYYRKIKKDYDKMKEYYLEAIKMKNSYAMVNLALYYDEIEKDYDKVKEYYLMAIKLGDRGAMVNLGVYYASIEKDYDKMKYCYLVAIELGDVDAMYNLGLYYQNVEKDYDKMKYYYSMAIELKVIDAMYNLGIYYKIIEKDYDKMKQYFLMAIECKDSDSMNALEICYETKVSIDPKLDQRLSLMKIDTCPICFMEIKLIPFDCMLHYFCIDCTCKIDKCALCRFPKI